MNLPIIGNEDETLVQAELVRMEGHEQIYRRTHPFPEPKRLSFLRDLGIEAVSTFLSGVGGLVLAGVRTATVFYLSEANLLSTYTIAGAFAAGFKAAAPGVATVSALLAVEGTLFAKGLKAGRLKGESKNAKWDMIFAFAISLIAGVISSTTLVRNVPDVLATFLSWSLVIITGFGATVLAYYGAENLGSIFHTWGDMLTAAQLEFEAVEAEWFSKMQNDYRNKGRTAIFGLEKYSAKKGDDEVPVEREVDQGVIDTVRIWLADNGLNASQVGGNRDMYSVTPSDIARACNLKSDSVRPALFRLRKMETQAT
jgi:hypothetical protein